MKQGTHPDYVETKVRYACGNTLTTRSILKKEALNADACSECHPLYTDKQKILDTGGRVARFERVYAKNKKK